MRILFHLGGENIGGNETLLYELAGFLRRQGHSLLLVTKIGVASEFLKNQFDGVIPTPHHFESWKVIYQTQEIDCAFGFYGDIFNMARAAQLAGVKTVWCCGHPYDPKDIPIPLTLLFDLVVTQSNFLAQRFQTESVPVKVCQNGIDTVKFSRDSGSEASAFRAKYQIQESKFLIGYPARLAAYKRHSRALEILSELNQNSQEFHLIFAMGATVGEERFIDDLSNQARKLNIEECLTLAFILPAKMPDFYSALDLAIFPALNEGFGIALLEAMAMQLPVVASASGGPNEILEHTQTGICIEESPQTNALFVNSVRDLRSQPALRRKLGRNARKKVEQRFSSEKMNHRYLSLLAELLNPL